MVIRWKATEVESDSEMLGPAFDELQVDDLIGGFTNIICLLLTKESDFGGGDDFKILLGRKMENNGPESR